MINFEEIRDIMEAALPFLSLKATGSRVIISSDFSYFKIIITK